MRTKKTQKMHIIVLTFANGLTRSVKVKAASRQTAEDRALKRNPAATGVKRGN